MCYHNQEGKRLLEKHGFAPYDIFAADDTGYAVADKDTSGMHAWDFQNDRQPGTFHQWESEQQKQDVMWALAHPIDSYPFPVDPVPEYVKPKVAATA